MEKESLTCISSVFTDMQLESIFLIPQPKVFVQGESRSTFMVP